MYLILPDTCDGIVVHLREHIGILLTTSDACRGDEVGVHRQTLCLKELIAGSYHTTIVQVYIIDKEPGTDAVGLQRTSFLN